ncbi:MULTISPECIES: ABC transporter substrate-binding protein [unclassified Peribacillus]|uniref:ABC transporter substrate-binding protein n=1 Tax=unclassified Peribacillus TaxID=2675266 RepID=UPI0019148C01|nr:MULTISPECIES: ABC transporter substrate-binding protein [unclassified Peribacillus]MBK5444084.1 ABC transporter substrate-binding protein [Peribacillus sp. TH24]MBK5461196.1 ABC transporter substrate-binding protein [Peribacillus sp. TH27]MBK5485483.1 ABC transporter substrate-binding protein [Peribacillus sp. TH16]MBK5499338.1 ABC transporter substrate-binding protein [Peribacillus sp. TH14]WMX55565.1 ABC transporter substrate-binding protein [Peribacillus sp. R9-11]
MKKKLFGIIVLATLVSSFMLGGCNQQLDQSGDANGEGIQKKKDELVMAFGSEPEAGFDPTTGWGRYGSPLFQSTLLKRDNKLNIVNDIATSYKVNEDGKVWTVILRKDVKFSDGQPLTADDVVFTFETATKNGSVVDLNGMDKVEAMDDYTVKFTLKEPQSTFVNSLVGTGIVPKHAYGADYAENPIGSGPYQLVQWDKGQQLIIKANPEYYDKKSYFKKITFLFLNEDASFAAAQAGKVDLAYIPAAFSNQEVPGMRLESVKTVDNRGIVFPFIKSGDFTEDGLPIGNDVTADPAIRHAINIGVDRKALVDGVLEGRGTPAYTSVDGLPWWNPDTVIKDADLDGARKLLKEAGWKDTDGDGILEKDSLKAEFTLYYLASDAIRQSLAISVADMIEPLGIHIKLEGGSWDIIEKKMYSNAVLLGWGSHDPHEMYNIYSSEFAGVDYYNTGFYQNKTVDDYFEKALRATSETEAIEFWKKAQWDGTTGLSANGDAPWAWLVNIDHLYLVKDGLDIGEQRIHVHGHGWPATDNIVEWKWTK